MNDKHINDGGPAFPENGSRGKAAGGEGMSLRDYFAAKAMQGLLADRGHYENYREIASDAYLLADAMLKKREASIAALKQGAGRG